MFALTITYLAAIIFLVSGLPYCAIKALVNAGKYFLASDFKTSCVCCSWEIPEFCTSPSLNLVGKKAEAWSKRRRPRSKWYQDNIFGKTSVMPNKDLNK